MTFKTPYPGYDVLSKWRSPSFNERTRDVIRKRLDEVPARVFFASDEWLLMDALAARLIPQPDRDPPIPITPWVDQALAENRGDGFRYDGMPPMQQSWRVGLAGIAAEAQRRHAMRFTALAPDVQDALLADIQQGEVDPTLWGDVPAARFFVQVLLKTVAGIYYAHPAAWSEIGFGGPASPRGYVRMGPDRRDPWEAIELRDA